MRRLAIVGVGGALGATVRYLVYEAVEGEPLAFPWATFVVNVFGCLAIGLAARRIARDSDLWAGLVVGGLGGLTTFSAFAVETERLLRDRPVVAVTYVVATLVVGLGATELARSGESGP